MPAFETFVEINSSTKTVWGLISNPQEISTWNPMVKSVDGKIGIGNTIVLKGDSGELRAVVKEIQTERKIVWGGNSPMPGVKFLRTQTIETLEANLVKYSNREELTGFLAVLLFPFVRNSLSSTYEKINAAIKTKAEGKI